MEQVAPPFNLSIPAVAQNMCRAEELVRAAGESAAELCVLPETVSLMWDTIRRHACSSRASGDWSLRIDARAPSHQILIKYKMIIVFGLMVRREVGPGHPPQLLNGAAVMDPNGQIAGCYFKRHPTPGEIDNGVTPGSLDAQKNPVVVRVTRANGCVLRIGLAVCFDVNWPQLWQTHAGKDPDGSGVKSSEAADLVVWISAYPGGMPLLMRALEMQLPVVSSVQGTQPSKVIDLSGRVKASTTRWQQLLVHNLCLQSMLFHTDGQADKIVPIQAKYGSEVVVESLCEEHLFVVSCEGSVEINTIVQEFGLVPYSEYLKQCSAAQATKRLHVEQGCPLISNGAQKRCRQDKE